MKNLILCVFCFLFISFNASAAGWGVYKTVTIDGYQNALPGGNAYHEEVVAQGVYRFRIDPTSVGYSATGTQPNYALNKAAMLMFLNRSDSVNKGKVYFYALNINDGLASEVIHTVPVNGGFDLFLADWFRGDNSGSVKVIIEKWQ
jgi:hypothetical protein